MNYKVIKSFGGQHGTFNEGDVKDVDPQIAQVYLRFGWLEAVEVEAAPTESKPTVAEVLPKPKKVKATRQPSKHLEQE